MCSTDYDSPSFYLSKFPVARKEHACSECSRTIKPKEVYKYTFGVWEKRVDVFKTCSHCLVVQNWLLVECNSYLHGDLYSEILEHAQEYKKMFLYRWAIGIRKKWSLN
jgi:hypothetical protein